MERKPVVLILADYLSNCHGLNAQNVPDRYIHALINHADATPLICPCLSNPDATNALLDQADGLVLTGSSSYVCAQVYQTDCIFDDRFKTLVRDKTAFHLIQRALAHDLPLLAICRGFQELAVFGGSTLHQDLSTLDESTPHGSGNPENPVQELKILRHTVLRQPGGLLEACDFPAQFDVNSQHDQGIATLGEDLHVEAIAPDGLVEAISWPGKTFALGVQWHPEAIADTQPQSARIFEEFGNAVRTKVPAAAANERCA